MNEYPRTNQSSSHPLAIVGFVLGILGLIGILPLVGSIGALIAGNMAQKEIREKPAFYSGENLARAGIIMGWIGVALAALACILVVLAFLFFMAFPGQPMPMY
ncbi:MAG: DUF4190 domain-containing protein [Chloroflexota bacterium]